MASYTFSYVSYFTIFPFFLIEEEPSKSEIS
jgi:hypothetical protein